MKILRMFSCRFRIKVPRNVVFRLNHEIKTMRNPKNVQTNREIKIPRKFYAAKVSSLEVHFQCKSNVFFWLVLLIKLYKIFYYQLQGFISTLHLLQNSLRRQFSK